MANVLARIGRGLAAGADYAQPFIMERERAERELKRDKLLASIRAEAATTAHGRNVELAQMGIDARTTAQEDAQQHDMDMLGATTMARAMTPPKPPPDVQIFEWLEAQPPDVRNRYLEYLRTKTVTEGEPEDIRKMRGWERVLNDPNSSSEMKAAASRKLSGSLSEKEKTAIGSALPARQAINELWISVTTEGAGLPIGALGQRQEQMHAVLMGEVINLMQRGANFTENERRIIESAIGGKPTDLMRHLRDALGGGTEAYAQRLQRFAALLDEKEAALANQRTGQIEPFRYAWETEQGTAPSPGVLPPSGNLLDIQDDDEFERAMKAKYGF